MTAPLKDQTPAALAQAIESAVLALTGRPVRVAVQSLKWDDLASRADVALAVWDGPSADSPWTKTE